MAAIYTFKDLWQEVLNVLDEGTDAGTTRTLAKQFINQAHVQRLGQEEWPFLRWDTPELLTLSTSTRFYSLHPEFWRPIYFFNQSTRAYLNMVPERQLAASGARWNTDNARALLFRYAGWTAVQTQPSSASTITIVSDNAADTGTANNITISGITTNNRLKSETLTPSGVSSVTTTSTYTKILRVTLAQALTGTLTVTSNAGAVTNLTLGPGDLGYQYPQIEFLANLISADIIEYRFYRQPFKLVNDNDLPDIPGPHSRILVWDALLLFAGYNTDLKAESIAVWREQRDKMERDLLETFIEGREAEANPRLIRDLEDDWIPGVPRVYSS